MAEKNNTKKTVSIEEITVSNMYEIEAVIRVLEKKGILTHQEVLEELKKIKEEQNIKNKIPKKEEAFAAIPDLLYVIDQCIALYVWKDKVRPSFTQNIFGEQSDKIIGLIDNSVLESMLMFIRKLNEFFNSRPQNNGDETLRAYHFGEFKENGWFLTKEEVNELNIRVGHISLEEVRVGKKKWPIDDIIRRALTRVISFLEFLLTCSETSDKPKETIIEKIKCLNAFNIKLKKIPQLKDKTNLC